MAEGHDEVRMLYRQYKGRYFNCMTLRDSYDSATSTVVVFFIQQKDALP